MYKIIGIVFIIFLITNACKKADNTITPTHWYYSTDELSKPLVDTLKASTPKPSPVGTTIPDTAQTANFVPFRLNSNNTAVVGTLTGVTMDLVPKNLLNLLTINNPPLASLSSTSTISGWMVKDVIAFYSDGTTYSLGSLLPDSVSLALSVMITFFPDGYYSVVNNRDSTRNDWGWYQVSLNDTLPQAIVYHSLGSGPFFTDPVRIPSPNQGYGIWGITSNSFYPLFLISSTQAIFLKMESVLY